ncbi:MAG TPA: VOC family protein [Methylomirabilota bacterium]|jgi:catechol 2,3-dioxygenase-like lactoylglutathione lyase family enzyme|nr:VOC family protein [Methylomirabilota bacterium]
MNSSPPRSGSHPVVARLGYVALVVNDVEAAAAVLSEDFGLRRTDCAAMATRRKAPVFRAGESALALFAPDDPFVGGSARAGAHHIALEVDDLDRATAQVTARGIEVVDDDERGLQGRRRCAVSPDSMGGVRAYLSEPLRLDPSPPGPVERLDHVGVASADNRVALEVFSGRLGLAVESTQTDLEVSIAVESFTSDKYGVVQHARRPQIQGGLRVAFVTIGDCELEFLQDLDPAPGGVSGVGGPGTTKQDQSAIARYIAARGPGLHHIALKVGDIDRTLAALERAGRAVIDRVGRPGSRRALIGFLHPRALHGVLLHLVQREAV